MTRYAWRLAAICGLVVFLVSGVSGPIGAQEPEQPWSSPWVTAMSGLEDNQTLVAATADGLLMREASVVQLDRKDLSKTKTLYSHPVSVWAVAATESKICSTDYRGNLRLMDRASSEVQARDGIFERWTRAILVSPDGKHLVAGNEAGKLFVLSFEKGEVVQTAELDQQQIYSLAFSPAGDQLAVSNGAGHVHVLSWPALTPVRKLELGQQPVWGAVFTADGQSIVAGGADRKLWLAPIAEGSAANVIMETGDWISAVQKSGDGKTIAVGTLAGQIIVLPSDGQTASVAGVIPSAVWSVAMPASDLILAATRKHAIASLGQAWEVSFAQEPQAGGSE